MMDRAASAQVLQSQLGDITHGPQALSRLCFVVIYQNTCQQHHSLRSNLPVAEGHRRSSRLKAFIKGQKGASKPFSVCFAPRALLRVARFFFFFRLIMLITIILPTVCLALARSILASNTTAANICGTSISAEDFAKAENDFSAKGVSADGVAPFTTVIDVHDFVSLKSAA
jgi:hypothetical protein